MKNYNIMSSELWPQNVFLWTNDISTKFQQIRTFRLTQFRGLLMRRMSITENLRNICIIRQIGEVLCQNAKLGESSVFVGNLNFVQTNLKTTQTLCRHDRYHSCKNAKGFCHKKEWQNNCFRHILIPDYVQLICIHI